MGIKGLMKLLSDHAPASIKEREISNYFNRVVAIDASMSLYQFLIAIRSGPEAEVLTNEAGEVTSHLQGMFYRTIRMLDNGIKPVFVFDGKAPMLKSGELIKRQAKRAEAVEDLKEAKESGDQEDINRYTKRLVRVTSQHVDDVRRLLRLMGVPIVEAPSEAEAQCAELVKKGVVWATATEDMDALTFGSSRLLRHLTYSEARKAPIVEIELDAVLAGLQLSMDEFIDLCILCGCDYAGSIKGVGPHTALKLIREHHTIDAALRHVDLSKHPLPDPFHYKEAHELFAEAAVTPGQDVQLEWRDADAAGLVEFLVREKGFNQDRVESAVRKLKAVRGKGQQGRIDSFFTVQPKEGGSSSSAAGGKKVVEKRKAASKSGKGAPAAAVKKAKK